MEDLPVITMKTRMTILKTLRACAVESELEVHDKILRGHTFIKATPSRGVNPCRIVTKVITAKSERCYFMKAYQ